MFFVEIFMSWFKYVIFDIWSEKHFYIIMMIYEYTYSNMYIIYVYINIYLCIYVACDMEFVIFTQ